MTSACHLIQCLPHLHCQPKCRPNMKRRFVPEIDEGPGALSLKCPGENESDEPTRQLLEDCCHAAFFDALIGQQDRHSGNWLWDAPTGRLTLIDHGCSFARRGDPCNRSRLSELRRRRVDDSLTLPRSSPDTHPAGGCHVARACRFSGCGSAIHEGVTPCISSPGRSSCQRARDSDSTWRLDRNMTSARNSARNIGLTPG